MLNLPFLPNSFSTIPTDQFYFIEFTLDSDDGSVMLLPGSGNGPVADVFIDDSGATGTRALMWPSSLHGGCSCWDGPLRMRLLHVCLSGRRAARLELSLKDWHGGILLETDMKKPRNDCVAICV